MYRVYGALEAGPMGGPIEGGTSVMIGGFGFSKNKPACKFGVDDNNIIVQANFIDSEHMSCVSPRNYPVPDVAKLPMDLPLEIGFGDLKNRPWTKSSHKFRFYKNPKII